MKSTDLYLLFLSKTMPFMWSLLFFNKLETIYTHLHILFAMIILSQKKWSRDGLWYFFRNIWINSLSCSALHAKRINLPFIHSRIRGLKKKTIAFATQVKNYKQAVWIGFDWIIWIQLMVMRTYTHIEQFNYTVH